MRKAYGYIDDDRAVVTRPAALREVEALKVLRTGNATSFLDSVSASTGRQMRDIRGLDKAIQRMLDVSWIRTHEELVQYKREIWHRNENLIERLIRGL